MEVKGQRFHPPFLKVFWELVLKLMRRQADDIDEAVCGGVRKEAGGFA